MPSRTFTTPAVTRRALSIALVVALAIVMLPSLVGSADAAAPGGWGAMGGDGANSNSSPGQGPAVPGVRWSVEMGDLGYESDGIIGGTAGSGIGHFSDAQGNLVLQAKESSSGDRGLVSLDREDGSLRWFTEHLTFSEQAYNYNCRAVLGGDGTIWAIQGLGLLDEPVPGDFDGAHVALVGVDPATGELIDGKRYTGVDHDAGLRNCADSLQVSADGQTLLFTEWTGFSGVRRIRGIDITASEPSERWTPIEETVVDDRPVVAPAGSPGEGNFYLLVDDYEGEGLSLVSYSMATGGAISSQPVPGGGQWGVHAADDGAVYVRSAVAGHTYEGFLVRIDDSGNGLTTAWQVDIERADDAEDRFQRNLEHLVIAGGHLVGHYPGHYPLVGIDPADGSVLWHERSTGWSSNNTIGDADGNLYTADWFLQSYGPDGQRRWAFEDQLWADTTWGEYPTNIGPLTSEGTLYVSRGMWIAAIENGTERFDGGSSGDAPVDLCQWIMGDGKAASVLLARDDVFADALAGSPLAGDHSCFLFNTGGPTAGLDSHVSTEISRVLPAGGTVRILGGTNAVSTGVEAELRAMGFAVDRIAGGTRYETAALITDRVMAANPGTTTAMLAFAGNWPDAVTAGAFGAAAGIPILLTDPASLHPDASAALQRHNVTRTYVLGGTAVVSDAAASAAPGHQRVSGPNRFATAAEVGATLWPLAEPDPKAIVLVNLEHADSWKLSLAAAPLSAKLGAPQVGVAANRYPDESKAYLSARGFDATPGLFALGDLSVIADDVVTEVAHDLRQ